MGATQQIPPLKPIAMRCVFYPCGFSVCGWKDMRQHLRGHHSLEMFEEICLHKYAGDVRDEAGRRVNLLCLHCGVSMPFSNKVPTKAPEYGIQVYLDDGRVYSYNVPTADKAREHSAAIVAGGYRHNDGITFEHYPTHRILKVKVIGPVPTKYPDKASGT